MTEPAPEVTAETAPAEDSKPEIDWKAKARDWEKRAKANADAASKLAQLEESQKSEAQRLAERTEAAEKAAQEQTVKAMRLEVAFEKGLTPAQAKRLVGSSREELAADADEILADFPTKPGRPRGDVDQGTRRESGAQTPAQEFASFLQGQIRQ